MHLHIDDLDHYVCTLRLTMNMFRFIYFITLQYFPFEFHFVMFYATNAYCDSPIGACKKQLANFLVKIQ